MIFRIAECCGKDWNHQAWKLEPNLRGTNTCMYQECTYVQVHVHKYMLDLWNITCFTPFTIIIDHHTTDLLLRVTHVYQMKTCIGICVCVCTCPVAGDGTSRIPQKRRINRASMGQKKKTVTAQRVETPQRPFIFVYNKWYIHNRSLLRYWTEFFLMKKILMRRWTEQKFDLKKKTEAHFSSHAGDLGMGWGNGSKPTSSAWTGVFGSLWYTYLKFSSTKLNLFDCSVVRVGRTITHRIWSFCRGNFS